MCKGVKKSHLYNPTKHITRTAASLLPVVGLGTYMGASKAVAKLYSIKNRNENTTGTITYKQSTADSPARGLANLTKHASGSPVKFVSSIVKGVKKKFKTKTSSIA
jgi:hypothetical protein